MSKIAEALRKVNQIRRYNAAVVQPGQSSMAQHSIITKADVHSKSQEKPVPNDTADSEEYFSMHEASFAKNVQFQNLMIGFAVLAGIASAVLCFKTLAEIRKNTNSTAVIADDVRLQQKKINAIESAIAEVQLQQDTRIKNLTTKLNAVTESVKKDSAKDKEVTKAIDDLRSSVSDIQWTIKSLTDKYISINARLNKTNDSK